MVKIIQTYNTEKVSYAKLRDNSEKQHLPLLQKKKKKKSSKELKTKKL